MAQQLLLHLLHVAGTEIEAEGGPQSGQMFQRFALRHPGAAAGSAEHDRLHKAGDGELLAQGGGRGLISTQAGYHLHGDIGVGQPADLLRQGAIEAGITIVQSHHAAAGAGPLHHHGQHLLQGERAGADSLATIRSQSSDLGIDQRIGPHQHLGRLDGPGGPQGEQIGGTRPGSHNLDIGAFGLGAHRGEVQRLGSPLRRERSGSSRRWP